MKAKTARRFLARNSWKLARLKIERVKKYKIIDYTKRALKTLIADVRKTKNKASISALNNYLLK